MKCRLEESSIIIESYQQPQFFVGTIIYEQHLTVAVGQWQLTTAEVIYVFFGC